MSNFIAKLIIIKMIYTQYEILNKNFLDITVEFYFSIPNFYFVVFNDEVTLGNQAAKCERKNF